MTEAAGDIADEHGWDALSLALVAERCGVKVPSLYKHVASLGALKDAVAAQALTSLAAVADASVGETAHPTRLAALAHGYRDFARAHPGRYASTVRARGSDEPLAAAASERALAAIGRALEGYGLEGDEAVHGVRAVRAAIHGFVLLETAGGFGMPQSVDTSFERLIAGLDASLRTSSM